MWKSGLVWLSRPIFMVLVIWAKFGHIWTSRSQIAWETPIFYWLPRFCILKVTWNWPYFGWDIFLHFCLGSKSQETPVPHDHLAPHSVRLEASKKVLLVHMPQGPAKLWAVKVLVLQKIKSVHRWRCFHMKIWYIKSNVQFLKNEKVWQPVTLQPLEANGQVVPFWKPPIS